VRAVAFFPAITFFSINFETGERPSSSSDVKLSAAQERPRGLKKKGVFSMPSTISCSGGHATRKTSIREAAIALSEKRPVGTCEKCGKPLQYRLDHLPANNDPKGEKYSYVVTRAVRLKGRLADSEGYGPFLLVLREVATGKEQILPVLYSSGRTPASRAVGAPLLTFEEWKTFFRRLDASFSELEERIRTRAYELYERRGRRDGHALEDWVQAEAEEAGNNNLRIAA
jgi:Protein of unknown function (DUF2934)